MREFLSTILPKKSRAGRFILPYLLTAFLLLFLGAFGYYSMNQMGVTVHQTHLKTLERLGHLDVITNSLSKLIFWQNAYLLETDKKELHRAYRKIEEAEKRMLNTLMAFNNPTLSQDIHKTDPELFDLIRRLQGLNIKIVEVHKKNRTEALALSRVNYRSLNDITQFKVNALRRQIEAEADRINLAQYRRLFFYVLSGVFALFLVIIMLAMNLMCRARAEAALLETEKRYQVLFNRGNDAIFVHHINEQNEVGPFLEVNDVACRQLGYTRDELLKLSPLQIDAPEEIENLEYRIRELQKNGRVLFETKHQTKKGGRIPVEVNAHLFQFDNKPTVLSITRDITKRKQAELDLLESREKYTLAQCAANIVTWDWNILTGNLECSDQIQTILGLEPGESITTPEAFLEYIHPNDRENVQVSLTEAIEFKKEYEIEFRMILADRSIRWMKGQGDIFRDKDGNPVRMLGIVLDITDSKESIDRFRTILDGFDALIYAADMETHKILFLNKYGREIFGDIEGKTCWKTLQAGQDGPCSFCTNQYLINSKGNPVGPYHWQSLNTANKEWYDCRDQAIRWMDGRIVRMEIATNITGHKEAELEQRKLKEKLNQSQKMEAIGTLAGGIAHDFNNILSVILGFTDMTLEDLPKDSIEHANLQMVLESGFRAKELVKQILTFSRQTDQELKPIKIQVFIKEALKLLRSSIPTTIEIKHDIDSGCDAVLADPTQVQQVVMNLCTNAYHAMRETGGTITVSLKPVHLTSQEVNEKFSLEPGSYLKLEVSDSGCGMNDDLIDKIFEPYFTTKEKGEGTGLGLAMVHGIVTSYGGEISVYSEKDEGTTFHVYLPSIQSAMELRSSRVLEPLPTGNERILLVDDNEKLVKVHQAMLESLGYQVTSHTSSRDTLKTFQEQPDGFDLLLTDMTMPMMTGAELAREIQAIRQDLPIMLCTGFSELINEEKAKKLGIRAYVMKPVIKSELARSIRKALEIQ